MSFTHVQPATNPTIRNPTKASYERTSFDSVVASADGHRGHSRRRRGIEVPPQPIPGFEPVVGLVFICISRFFYGFGNIDCLIVDRQPGLDHGFNSDIYNGRDGWSLGLFIYYGIASSFINHRVVGSL
ncbi:hypothetical protein PG994_003420 [Apiospora phragmitis]|uniref:Uncharacterized protein n=1 Tax=Apiospora phragmitis TaxID=2905665 RepID=A0ABR1VY52_9PEZI